MKTLIYILLGALLFIGCDDENNPTSDKDKDNEVVKQFKSHNIKQNGTQYFTFSTNTGTATEPAVYDIAFGAASRTAEPAPCQFFTMPNDPVIFCSENTSIAKFVDAVSLKDVKTIPSDTEFKSDDNVGVPYIGKNWFDAQFNVKNDLFLIKSCSGNYTLLDIQDFKIDITTHKITSLIFSYKFQPNGGTDFTNIDSVLVISDDPYAETRYYSFESGLVSATDAYDIKLVGSSVWLGPSVTAKRVENVSFTNVGSVSGDALSEDVLPSYITSEWYNYNPADHSLSPKDYVYVVKTLDGKYAAFEITNYYDDKGESGTFSIEWKYL